MPLLLQWRAAVHVRRWWGDPVDLEAEYFARAEPVDVFVASAGGRDVVRGVRVDVAQANRRSWRCLEKLGFERVSSGVTVEGEPGPHYVYTLAAPGASRTMQSLRRRAPGAGRRP